MKPTNFHLNGKGFIHFHDETDCLWADIFLSKGRQRMPANTESEQAGVIGPLNRHSNPWSPLHRKEKQGKVEQIEPSN